MELGLSLGLIRRRDDEEEILMEDQDEEDERSFNDLQLRLQPSARINSSASSSSSKLGFPWANEIIKDPSRGLDVNVTPSTSMSTPGAEDGIPRAVTGSPNSTLLSSSNGEDDENGNSRKKLRLSKEQSAFLEESFKEHTTLNPKQKVALAKQLSLRPRQVEVWFQNRRARTKLKQTEVDCEYLKRCCETLTEENRRLQKELSELRALRTQPHPFCANLPATTLSMCPSCEKTTTTPTTTANSNGNVHPHANSNSNGKANNTSLGSLFASAKPGFYPFAHRPATSPAS